MRCDVITQSVATGTALRMRVASACAALRVLSVLDGPQSLEFSPPAPEGLYPFDSFGSSRAKNLENSVAPSSLR